MIKRGLFKYLASKPKIIRQILMATGIKRAVFETAYGEVSVPVNSKSIIQAFLNDKYFGEKEILNFLGLTSASTTIVNIGANVGTAARIFQKKSKYKSVKCFEPDPDNFAGLQANCGGCSTTELHNSAIGSSNGSLSLNLNPTSVGRHSFKVDFAQGSIKVPVTTLDQHLDSDEKYDLFMDVEGWEIEVLKGAKSTLKNCQLCALEWNEHLHDSAEKSDMLNILLDAEFSKFADLSDSEKLYDISDFQKTKGQRDVVFLRGERQSSVPPYHDQHAG